MSIKNGVLYVVATPIGNLNDISARAIEVLSEVDLVAAEDTRHSRTLMQHLGISTRMLSLHEHNEEQAMAKLLEALQQGEAVALISDAGTPLISDPGFILVRECHRRGIRVSPIPGPCAAVVALSASGLPSDHFRFEGFPSRTGSARRAEFELLKDATATMLFYESSHRVKDCLQDMAGVFGEDRPAVLARELTKLHETIRQETLGSLCLLVQDDPMQNKGEFVLLVAGHHPEKNKGISPEVERTLGILMEELSLKQAASLTAKLTGEKKNRLYQHGLEMQKDN